MVTRITGAPGDRAVRRAPDDLVVEEPMSIQVDGVLVATTMRTPGHDYELAAGFCFTEGLLAGAPVQGVRYCADGPASDSEFNAVTVETGGRAPTPVARLGPASSSCGVCGTERLDELTARLAPLAPVAVDLELLGAIPERVIAEQRLFDATGAVHAAAAFELDTGDIVRVREDVGRHNAVDKVIGASVLAGPDQVPGRGHGLFVSGRASIEMVQKAWSAGYGVLVAVSAPTALAVGAARRANLVLVGFVRPDGFNVYAPERVSP